jgi:hypothetical protein
MNNHQLPLPLSELSSRKYRGGTFRRIEAVKEALKSALDKSGLTRELIAEELSRLVGRNISVHQLNNWAAPEKKDRYIPLDCVGALAVILQDTEVVQAALEGSGFQVIGPMDAAYLELGKITAEEKRRRKRKRKLMESLGI